MECCSFSVLKFSYQFPSHVKLLVIAVMIFAGATTIIITTTIHTAHANYGSLGYETINGRATGWEWGTSQPQSTLEPDPANPRLQVITQGVREGNQSLKATVYPTDSFNDGARAEVVHYNRQQGNYYLFTDGQEVEYKWYTKIPAVFPMKNKFHIITQWHQVPGESQCWRNNILVSCPAVPLLVNLRDYDNNGNPTLELLVINKQNADNFDRLWSRELVPQDRDVWHEFRLLTKWSACDTYDHTNGRCMQENDGAFIEFWFNGKKQPITMPVTPFYNMDDDKTVYMKQGLYHCRLGPGCPYNSSDAPLSIYHDGMEFTDWSAVASRISLTSIERINEENRALFPEYQLTQSGLEGYPEWKIFHYFWNETSNHYDVEATVGIVPSNNEYVVEVGKLTYLGIKIDIDGGRQSITIPATPPTGGQVGSGFVRFTMPR
jgi:polysaccharide lyase-like protein